MRSICMRKITFAIQSRLHGFPYKSSLYLSLLHWRVQITCDALKGDLSPVMLKEIFHESFEITRICMENHASVTGWQKLFFSNINASNFQRPLQPLLLKDLEIYGWKYSGYLILICSFSLCWQNVSKLNCFRVYRKWITWSSHTKSLLISKC